MSFVGPGINLDLQIKGSREPYFGTDSGAANTYVVTTSGALSGGGPGVTQLLRIGSKIMFFATHANTGASTLAVNGLSAIPIKKDVSMALASGDILAGQLVEVVYDGTNFQTVGGAGGAATWGSITGTLSSQTDLETALQQESAVYAADTGTANAYAVALTVAPTLVAGSLVVFKAAHANTGASTLAVNGGAAKSLVKKANQALVAGDILAGQIIEAVYDGTNFQISGNGSTGSSPVVIGFVINNGAVGNNVGAMLQPARAGTISKCAIVTKSSDGLTGLTFRIMQNGVDVFTSDPTVSAGTSPGTTSSSTSLTSNPLPVAVSDVFQIDILTGSPNWAFTAQLET